MLGAFVSGTRKDLLEDSCCVRSEVGFTFELMVDMLLRQFRKEVETKFSKLEILQG